MLLCRKARLLSSLKLFMSLDSGSASPLLPEGASARAAAARPVVVGGSRLLPIPRPDRLLVNTEKAGKYVQQAGAAGVEHRRTHLYACKY
jgi:hypothetical protein